MVIATILRGITRVLNAIRKANQRQAECDIGRIVHSSGVKLTGPFERQVKRHVSH